MHVVRCAMTRMGWAMACAAVLLLAGGAAQGRSLKSSVKKESVSFRLVGRAAPVPITSFGANYESYVAALQSPKTNDVSLVKVVYRFLSYDPRLPVSFVDYDLVHTFRAVRQPDCDESASAMLYSHPLSHTGEVQNETFTFEYAKHASDVTIAPAVMLPCYVITPADYKGSNPVPQRDARPLLSEKQAAGK